jgi:DNA-binding XRE family transcriptional regulator
MAIGIVVDRIRSLPSEDRQDLYELSKAVGQAETEEELESAARAMYEILEQPSVRVEKMDVRPEVGEGLRKWIAYVSKRIVALRKEKGMTQTQLAKESGLPQSHISRLESGKHSPSFATIEKLAKALRVPVSKIDPSA